MNDEDPIVTIRHIRHVGLCARGARMWFAQKGLDYAVFLKEGYPASVLEATGDALALKVAAAARNGED